MNKSKRDKISATVNATLAEVTQHVFLKNLRFGFSLTAIIILAIATSPLFEKPVYDPDHRENADRLPCLLTSPEKAPSLIKFPGTSRLAIAKTT